MEFIKSNLTNICSILFGVILLASIIVKITPSTKDNEFLDKIITILDKFSIAKTADDKDALEKAKKNIK